jgi:hypothetical protein
METCANAMMSALRMRLQLGGSRLQRVRIVLGDEAKLAAFRDVAVEALRGTDEAPRAPDLGLPVEHTEVAAEGPTFIDAGHRARSEPPARTAGRDPEPRAGGAS